MNTIKSFCILSLMSLFVGQAVMAKSTNFSEINKVFDEVYKKFDADTQDVEPLVLIHDFLKKINDKKISYQAAYVVHIHNTGRWTPKVYHLNTRDEFSEKIFYTDENDNEFLEDYVFFSENYIIAFVVIDGKVYDFLQRKRQNYRAYRLKDYLEKTLLPISGKKIINLPEGVIPRSHINRSSQLEYLLNSPLEVYKPQLLSQQQKDGSTHYKYSTIASGSAGYRVSDLLLLEGISYKNYEENLQHIDSKSKEKQLRKSLHDSRKRSKQLKGLLQNSKISSKDSPFL